LLDFDGFFRKRAVISKIKFKGLPGAEDCFMKRSVANAHYASADQIDMPRTIAESIYQRLRQDILWGRFAPGSPLRSDVLRARYDVGISPLREALTRLASERLVTSVGQRGFRVAPLTAYDVEDTLITRLVLERDALTRSIENGDIAWETAVVGAFHALSRNPIPKEPGPATEGWAICHRQFHMALLSACGSRWQMELAGLLFDQAERHRMLRVKYGPQQKLKRDTVREHKQIFDAALSRDVKAAVTALQKHYETTAKQVVSVIARVPRLVSKQV
jgi:GntR family transcriptional regulator, carbon starvation induced regulator